MNPVKRVMLEGLRRASLSTMLGDRLDSLAGFIKVSRTGSHDIRTNGELILIRRVLRSLNDRPMPAVIFDVGANVGEWTSAVLSASVHKVEIHCFEPIPATFEVLERRHGGDSRVHLNRVALSDAVGEAVIRDYGGESGLNSLVEQAFHEGDYEMRAVATVTGDSYCARHRLEHIDLLKIDVEGFEWEVLTGFEELLAGQRISVIQFEYGYVNASVRHLMRDFYERLQGFGYRLGPIRPIGPEFRPFRPTDDNFESGPNYVAALPGIADLIRH